MPEEYPDNESLFERITAELDIDIDQDNEKPCALALLLQSVPPGGSVLPFLEGTQEDGRFQPNEDVVMRGSRCARCALTMIVSWDKDLNLNGFGTDKEKANKECTVIPSAGTVITDHYPKPS